MQETYNDLIWDIDDIPIGSSTPDEFFELSYRASTSCPDCGNTIDGTAQYWSREEGSGSWLERVDYESCPCEEEVEDDYDYEDDEPDDLKSIFNNKNQ
jgi:hypothetical protein